MGATAPLGVGALRLDACGVIDHAGEGERDRTEPHRHPALVGRLVQDISQLRAGHAGRDAPDVREDRPSLGRRQRHIEGIVELVSDVPF